MFFVMIVLATLGVSNCSVTNRHPESVMLFAAASTTDAISDIVNRFEQQNLGARVTTNFAASSTLAHQIESGAGADLFLSANEEWVAYLAKKGFVAERRDLLGNQLVVVVPAGSPLRLEQPSDLLDENVQRIAIGEPDAVPAGIYAKQALTKLGLWEKLRAKCVPSANVRQALLYVEEGETEAGIVYATDAAISDKVRVAFAFNSSAHEPIVYPLVLLKHGAETPGAKRLYAYLAGPEAAKVFRESGFTVLDGGE